MVGVFALAVAPWWERSSRLGGLPLVQWRLASPTETGGARPAGDAAGASKDRGSVDADERLASLCEKYRERVRLFAMRRLRDAAGAEDVVQEALRRTLEALREGRVQNPEALPGFLYQTAENICMHQARSAGRRNRALAWFSRSAADDASPEPNPLLSLINEERRTQVRQALERLEPEDRELLDLVYGQELDASEIGRRLTATPGAVRVRKHRAIQRLAALLDRGKPGNEAGPEGT